MNILITGGAGFIGSNFVEFYLENCPEINIVNLDKLTYAGELSNLNIGGSHSNYTFVQGDICNRSLIESLFEKHKFNGVIHFAAESHVDNSINNPSEFIQTNVLAHLTF
ncbi:dTDP-glucose 4,6-dehydratase [Flavobacteriaceae bacterium MAR_2010_72]|nr:dTDP-glucose 4,6-dehydratase [Flavobacteriaceae bacterium MAR_2010_72]